MAAGGSPAGRERVVPEPTWAQLPDQVLARRAALGDRGAFTEIFHRHGPAMYRYALHMLGGQAADAEDAVQNAWIRVWLHLDTFRGDAQLRTWLFSVLAREVSSLRSRRRPVTIEDTLLADLADDAAPGPDEQVSQAGLQRALLHALWQLPWRQRACWILCELDGLSYEQAARVLQTSVTVVRGQLHRARKELAVRMAEWR